MQPRGPFHRRVFLWSYTAGSKDSRRLPVLMVFAIWEHIRRGTLHLKIKLWYNFHHSMPACVCWRSSVGLRSGIVAPPISKPQHLK